MPKERAEFTVEDAPILYRNFAGAKTNNNALGSRNFCVVLPEEDALIMERDGWNIKRREPREEGDDVVYYLQIKINFDSSKPPRITLISSAGQTPITVDTIAALDQYDIKSVDVRAVAYSWEGTLGSGISAYLVNMYVVIDEDVLDLKYADVPK